MQNIQSTVQVLHYPCESRYLKEVIKPGLDSIATQRIANHNYELRCDFLSFPPSLYQ